MKVLKNVITWIIILVLAAAVAVSALMLTGKVPNPFAKSETNATISAEQVEEQITKCADLTTAKLTYKGIVNFTEGQIKYITQNSFNMMYTAEAVAGVDLSKVTVEVQDPADGNAGKVIVNVPKATVQTVTIDPDSLEFYDTKWALFNKNANTDVQDALKAAEADARANMGKKELIQEAQDQAEEVIRGFVQNVLPENYTLEIN